ncbi:MAG: WecB/TagA/CpsF family glycosyltransferase [Chitinophagaceae bacterium]|nr:WecB/TagA/CpsF family glycosyltransferase [Chitinophagaceae bacterium]
MDILGFNVFNGQLSDIDHSSKHLINTFSPNSYGIARNDLEFKTALKNTDILVLDGMGIAIGSLLLYGKNIKKIAGQDCFDYFINSANERKWRVFFLGSTNETISKILGRLKKEFPQVVATGYSPPFKTIFSEEDSLKMISAINAFQPNVLFIGMTAPKQEKWAYQYREKLNTNIICTIGNVFDWYVGNSKRPAKIWIKLRLEWLIRIFLRPEIFRRNTGNQLLFFKDLMLVLLKVKRIK